jgi:hypothetical protein
MRKKEIYYTSYHIEPTCTINEEERNRLFFLSYIPYLYYKWGRKKRTILPTISTLPVLQMRKKEIDYTSYHIDPTCTTNEEERNGLCFLPYRPYLYYKWGRKKYTILPLIWTLPVLQIRKKEIDYPSSHINPTCTTNEEERNWLCFLSYRPYLYYKWGRKK